MSVKKTIKDEIHYNLDAFSQKLEAKIRPTLSSRLIAIRNWLTHVLLWTILSILLSSCFVSGRTIHVATPKVSIEADTATAFTLPYRNNSITY